LFGLGAAYQDLLRAILDVKLDELRTFKTLAFEA
jgi:hypothetical protein